MPEQIFFAFGGHGDVAETSNDGIEIWDLHRTRTYEQFVARIKQHMSIEETVNFEECMFTKLNISRLYEKCRWGILLPFDRLSSGEYSFINLMNLYSTNFLHPYFHVLRSGPAAFMYFNLGQNKFYLFQDQNQSAAFGTTKFSSFFNKMNQAIGFFQPDRRQTCEWEYDDCNLYLANGLFHDLYIYQSKNPEKAGREYADISMILELLLTTKNERERGAKKKTHPLIKWIYSLFRGNTITGRIRKRSTLLLALSGKKKDVLWRCMDQRGNYLHGEFVQEVLGVMRDECAELSGATHFESAPALRLIDFDFSRECTRYTRYILVSLFYLQTKYRAWCKQNGGYAQLTNSALSQSDLRQMLQNRAKEVLQLLPDY